MIFGRCGSMATYPAQCSLNDGRPTLYLQKFLSRSPLLQIASVFMRLEHVASIIANANHSIV